MTLPRDGAEGWRIEEDVWHQANFDGLTGLPNRRLLYDRLDQALAFAARDHQRVVVIFLDFDRFEAVRESYGDEAVDELLRQAAARLCAAMGETDTVARLGGDVFVILRPGLAGDPGVERMARALLAAMRQPFRLGDVEVAMSVSLGSTVFPDDGDSAVELLKNADTALFQAKRAGRDSHRPFRM